MKYAFLFVAIISFSASAQNDDEPDFVYNVKSEIKTANNWSVGIEPLNFAFMGSHIKMGIGAQFDVSDLMDKFSFGANYRFNYINYSIDKNKVQYSTVEPDTKLRSMNFDGYFGYTFNTTTDRQDWLVTLKSSGRTDYVAVMPSKTVTNISATIGFNTTSFYSISEGTITGEYYDEFSGITYPTEELANFLASQSSSSISLGVRKRTSANTEYKTDKFGIVNHAVEITWVGELLIGLPSTMPDFYQYLYQDASYPNEISSSQAVTEAVATQINDTFKRMPVGLRFGYIQNSFKKLGFGWNANLALYPGNYGSILDLVELKIGVSYNFRQLF
jgi:hypothetical protein